MVAECGNLKTRVGNQNRGKMGQMLGQGGESNEARHIKMDGNLLGLEPIDFPSLGESPKSTSVWCEKQIGKGRIKGGRWPHPSYTYTQNWTKDAKFFPAGAALLCS